MKITTRSLDPFREGEVDKLVAYGEQFWEQTLYHKAGIKYDKYSVKKMTEYLAAPSDNGGEGVVLFAHDEDDNVVGLLLVIIGPFPMNHAYRAATEWVFYVDPAHRKAGVGQELIAKAEKVLRYRGVRFFTMVSLSNVQPEAAEGLYKSLGYQHAETSFTKDLG